MSSPATQAPFALLEELQAINSIYGLNAIHLTGADREKITTTLCLPSQPLSFLLTFPLNYPTSPPVVLSTLSTDKTSKGHGDVGLQLLQQTLQSVFQPGSVCLFDLILEAESTLKHPKDTFQSSNNSPLPPPNPTNTASAMFHALIRTHHITSRKKVAAIKAATKHLNCYTLLRSGGVPGLMYFAGPSREDVQSLVDTIHGLRYKDYQLVAEPSPAPTGTWSEGVAGILEEVDAIRDMGAKMEQHGILDWWRKAMGYMGS